MNTIYKASDLQLFSLCGEYFLLSVMYPELKDAKMTRCSNHSWIQIVLSFVGAPFILCWSPVLCDRNGDVEGWHLLFIYLFCFIWTLEHILTLKSHPFAVGLLFDEAGFLKVLEKPVIDMGNGCRLLS